jgi:hypothetical protein
MLAIRNICLLFVGSICSANVFSGIDLSSTVNCTYQTGQVLHSEEAKNVTNKTPLNWTFNSLLSDKPIFVSGGDSGEVIATKMEEGVIIYLPYSVGTSTFTIWSTGESFWSKQSNLLGKKYSQHFLGSCEN